MSTVAVIPARGGSKGIPRKNLRPLSGKPLIYYTIKTALESEKIDDVVLTTEDEEIAEVAAMYGAEVVRRPQELSGDDVTLDPVIYHAVNELEQQRDRKYDYVVTIQPTSPLLSVRTLDDAISKIQDEDYDTVISASEERHLYWKSIDGEFKPAYEERKNRQYLTPLYKETGAFVITKREFVTERGRFGRKIKIYIMPADEALDIDRVEDWWVAENMLRRLRIVIRTDGGGSMGMGHVYRCLTLANRLGLYHDITFLMSSNMQSGILKVKETNYPILVPEGGYHIAAIKRLRPQIVINDILDTTEAYMKSLKEMGPFIANFEDLGPGAEMADVVINALYENTSPSSNHYYGYRYVCLRDEFLLTPPVTKVRNPPERLLITFGGSDPGNLTVKTIKALKSLDLKGVKVVVIVGMAYGNMDELHHEAEILKPLVKKLEIKRNVRHMAKEIAESDVVITSNGRTIYEVTSMGVPCVSISQNEREMRHLFSYLSGCIVNLGLANDVGEEDISRAVDELLRNPEKRAEINQKMLSFDLRGGTDRVVNLLIDRYRIKKKDMTFGMIGGKENEEHTD